MTNVISGWYSESEYLNRSADPPQPLRRKPLFHEEVSHGPVTGFTVTNEFTGMVSFPQAKRVGNPSEERPRTSRGDKVCNDSYELSYTFMVSH